MKRSLKKKASFHIKTWLVGMLAFQLCTGLASAEEASTSAEGSAKVTASAEIKTEHPSLLPGEFFYFVKSMVEKIQLALTTDDVKEAALLAGFAQERVAEANALIELGKDDKAKKSLKASIETQQLAVDMAEEAASKEVSKESKDKDKADKVIEIKAELQQNLLALSAAIERIDNPKANAALMKNVEKSFGKLEKKLLKLEADVKSNLTTEERSGAKKGNNAKENITIDGGIEVKVRGLLGEKKDK
jgi:hypothetical protein